MLRTFLWVSECRIAQDLCDAWAAHVAMVQRELEEAERRKRGTERRSSFAPDSRDAVAQRCHQISSRLAARLEREALEAEQAQQECATVVHEISSQLGRPLAGRPWPEPLQGLFLDSLVPLREQLGAAQRRVAELVARDRDVLHDLAVQEDCRRRSAAAESTVSLPDIDAMAPSAFVDLVEALLERDGYRTQRPTGTGAERLIVATNASDDSMIVSAQHVEGPSAPCPRRRVRPEHGARRPVR
ncbi:hypothetical protein AB0H73_38375 [Streptomyces olivoreticuli]